MSRICFDDLLFLFRYFAVELHRTAVQRAMLTYNGAAVYAYDISVGEGRFDYSFGLSIVVWLIVCRINHGAVHYHIVGVSGRKPVAIVIYCRRHGQAHQSVWLAVGCTERLQLFLHAFQVVIVAVALVVTSYI